MADLDEDTDEVRRTIERLGTALEDLAVRGVRAAAPADLGLLRSTRGELERVGAGFLAAAIGRVVEAVEADDAGAAAALLAAHTSLRLFERVLTLEVAAGSLETFAAESGEADA